jgi:hypothetical protein
VAYRAFFICMICGASGTQKWSVISDDTHRVNGRYMCHSCMEID